MSFPCQGRIIWVNIPNPLGAEWKHRTAVILTPDAEIVAGGSVTVAGISRQSRTPTHDVLLPWHREGKVRTMLKVECYAVAYWLVTVKLEDVDSDAGVVPPDEMASLLHRVTLPRPPGV